jgi:hypothetical protein
LVVLEFGRVPAKVARRLPIGLALTYAAGGISPEQTATANRLAAQGLVTWVNYPELGAAHGEYDHPWFKLDGKSEPLEPIVAVDQEAKRAWDATKGTVIASAITRMIARVVAGKSVQAAAGDDHPIAGFLLGLATQATLTATDTPDTRSWQTLPARLSFGRIRVKPGVHEVEVFARGARKRQRVTVKPGGFAVVAHTVLR